MKRIAAYGTLNCDLLFQGVPGLPSEGEEIFSKKFEMQLGGGFPAAMINLHRLGVPVSLSTFLGEDLFSEFLEGRIHDFGLDFLNLYEPGQGCPVTITSIAVTKNDRTFLSWEGKPEISDAAEEKIFHQMAGADIVCMGNSMFDLYSRLKKEKPGIQFIMDTGWSDALSLAYMEKYLTLADYYIPNEKEALKVTGTADAEAAAEVLERYFPEVIIKLGKQGCLYKKGSIRQIVPALDCFKQVDATGAGDAFLSGFLYGMYNGYRTLDCIRFGNIMGGLCVSCVGCLSADVREDILLQYWNQYYGGGKSDHENG